MNLIFFLHIYLHFSAESNREFDNYRFDKARTYSNLKNMNEDPISDRNNLENLESRERIINLLKKNGIDFNNFLSTEDVESIFDEETQIEEHPYFYDNTRNLTNLESFQTNLSSNNKNTQSSSENKIAEIENHPSKNRKSLTVNPLKQQKDNAIMIKKYIQTVTNISRHRITIKRKKGYCRININEKELRIINIRFIAACNEIKKYVRNIFTNKKEYILREEDLKYFSDKEKEILFLSVKKIRGKAFINSKCIYLSWKSKVLDILNRAPLVLYSILPEIVQFKSMIKNNNRRIKPCKGFYLKNLLILEFITQHDFLKRMKNYVQNTKNDDQQNLYFVDIDFIGIISYIRLCFQNIVLNSQFPKPYKRIYSNFVIFFNRHYILVKKNPSCISLDSLYKSTNLIFSIVLLPDQKIIKNLEKIILKYSSFSNDVPISSVDMDQMIKIYKEINSMDYSL